MKLSPELNSAVELLRKAKLDASQGMTQELFLLVSSLVPVPNIDLLVLNDRNQILLSYRNDPYFEKAWHIPGGCMRYGETFENRLVETAKRELGCEVGFDPRPIAVRNVLRGKNDKQTYPRERGHNVTILYRCWLPKDFFIQNGSLSESDNGYLKWFDCLPEDFLGIQHVYDDILLPWSRGGKNGTMEQ